MEQQSFFFQYPFLLLFFEFSFSIAAIAVMGSIFAKLGFCNSTASHCVLPLRHVLTGSSTATVAIPSSGLSLLYSSLTLRGYYPQYPNRENEDRLVVRTNLQGRADAHLFAVFDGHGRFGARCSAFVSDRFVDVLNADADLFRDPVKAFESAFRVTNSELRQSEVDDTMSGTTAIVVLVAGDTMYVANVGDSRAVAGVRRGGSVVAEDLSSDQTPFRKDEYERVRQCGARVLNLDQLDGIKDPNTQSWDDKDDPPRLWMPDEQHPGTAFTRSVGDATAESIGVIAEPEVLTMNISPELLFFVVASDGVFQFLSSQAVVDMVLWNLGILNPILDGSAILSLCRYVKGKIRLNVDKFTDPQDACSAIAAESYRRWLTHEPRTDDITIIVVHIKDLLCSNAGVIDQTSQSNSLREG